MRDSACGVRHLKCFFRMLLLSMESCVGVESWRDTNGKGLYGSGTLDLIGGLLFALYWKRAKIALRELGGAILAFASFARLVCSEMCARLVGTLF